MRIFVITQKTPNEIMLPTSNLWEANLQLPLQELGHELIRFEHPWLSEAYEFEVIDKYRPDFCEKLLASIRKEHERQPIDLFFSYFNSAHADTQTIHAIREMGITTLNWYCNASYQFHLVKDIAPAFDYCMVPEKFRLEDYRRVGANPIYSQEAANPSIYKWNRQTAPKYDVTFVGQRYGTRPEFVNHLYRNKIDVRVWGPYWQDVARGIPQRTWWKNLKDWIRRRPVNIQLPLQNCGPSLSDEDLIRIYGESKISLGFSTVAEIPKDGSDPIKQVRLRDFEATMSGAFYMVEEFDELCEFFEPDKEIVFFNSEEELADKAKFYLANPAQREKIREAGYHRAQAEHTWQKRFQSLFNKIGLEPSRNRIAG